jgi:hypothetical protein
MQACENKTQRMLDKTVDDEPVCVCVLRIIITKDKILPFQPTFLKKKSAANEITSLSVCPP